MVCVQTEPKNAYEWARVVSFGLLALKPPVRNEEFIEDVTRLVGGKKVSAAAAGAGVAPLVLSDAAAQNTLIYVICSSGGTLESASERKARPVTRLPPIPTR